MLDELLKSGGTMTPSELSVRPPQLVVTTVLIAGAVVAALIAAIWLWSMLPHPFVGSVLLAGSSILLLWFYWRGHSAARWIVIVLGILLIIDALNVFLQIRFLAPFSAPPDLKLGKAKYAIQLFICVYVVGWLLTRQAATYFSADARRGRIAFIGSRTR
jgi:hypothetical protein